jgi:hypothetical protein
VKPGGYTWIRTRATDIQQEIHPSIHRRTFDRERTEQIENAFKRLIPLDPAIGQISRSSVRRRCEVFSPTGTVLYFSLFGREGNYYANIGYMLEQLDLYLPRTESCVLARSCEAQGNNGKNGLPYIISLAVGFPATELHARAPANLTESPSKRFHAATRASMERSRPLAPSARNKQPWYFIGERKDSLLPD